MNGGDSNLGGPQALPTPPTQLSPTPPSRDSSPILEVPHKGKTSSRPFTIKVETPDDVTSKPEASLDASQTTNDSAPAPSAAPVETTKAEVAPAPASSAESSAMPAADVLPRSEADRGVGATSATSNGIDSTVDTATTNTTAAATTGAVNNTANIAAGAGTIGVSNVGNTAVATGAMGAAGNIEGGVNMGVIAGNGAIPSTGFPANTIVNTGVVPGAVVPANAYVDEDIVLNNQPAKKPKKWIIIGVIVALVMVLGGVGVAAVLSGRRSTSDNGISSKEINSSLNRYFNYLLSEADSDQPIDGDFVWSNGTILKNLSSDAPNTEYFNKLRDLFGNFINVFNQQNSQNDSLDYSEKYPKLEVLIENNELSLSALALYSATPHFSNEDIANMYIVNGKDATIEYIKRNYKNFAESNHELLNEYAEAELGLANSTIALIDEYNKNGCINDNVISEICSITISPSEYIDTIKNEISDYLLKLETLEYDIIDNVVDDSRAIYIEYERED